jgi:intracellular sulfur oxidation DsrE/DsrF family protein
LYIIIRASFTSEADYNNSALSEGVADDDQLKVLSGVSDNEAGNIPWVDTKQSIRSREMLNKMMEHESSSSILFKYLEANCSHMLVEPVGDTGIPMSAFDSSTFISDPLTRNLSNTFSKELFTDVKGNAGTYAFYSKELDDYYVGACVDFPSRLQLHYQVSRSDSVDRVLYNAIKALGGFEELLWKPVTVSPNYYLEFVQDNPQFSSDGNAFRILQSFTQYETRLVEQAVKSYLNPGLNGQGDISFPVNWDPDSVRESLLGSRPLIATTVDGEVYHFSSINNASQVLGTSRKTISTVINYPDSFVDCPAISKSCSFVEEDQLMKFGSPYANPYLREDMSGIDYSALPKGKVFAYDQDYNMVASFDNSSDAARQCGFGSKYYNISRNINKAFIEVVLGGVAMKLLFAQNKLSKGRGKTVVCTNTITGEVVHYASLNECVRSVNPSVTNTGGGAFTRRFLQEGHLYLGIYRLQYLEDLQS